MTIQEFIIPALLSGFLLTAVFTDQKHQRIPNLLTGPMLLAGIAAQTLFAGLAGLGAALAGALVGFGVFLIPYIRKGMAAGDVKLMAAVGAFVGAQSALYAALLSLLAGALICLAVVTYQFHREKSPTVRGMLGLKVPYASAIAIGTAGALIIEKFQWTL